MELFCTNCGSQFQASDSPRVTTGKLGNEYVCPVCEFFPVWAKEIQVSSPTAMADFEHSIRQTLIEAKAGGLPANDIIAVLKNELLYAAESGGTGHAFLVQVIDLGSPTNSNTAFPIPESRDSHQTESNNT